MILVDMEAQLICFKHCKFKIFCCDIPEQCPGCRESLFTTTFSEIPFRLPYPFVKAQQYPCAVVMKPTMGTFLDSYQNDENLHIALTDSKGSIVDYDSKGVQRGEMAGWEQSILIYEMSEHWMDHWNTTLRNIEKDPFFTTEKYDEVNHNCYTFVLEFLRRLKYKELNEFVGEKEKFCETFVVPKCRAAGIYITLYRKVKKFGYYVEGT